MPTIEACFNCFGNRSSEAKKIIRRQQNPRNSNFTPNHLDSSSPLPGGGKKRTLPDGASAWKGLELFAGHSTGVVLWEHVSEHAVQACQDCQAQRHRGIEVSMHVLQFNMAIIFYFCKGECCEIFLSEPSTRCSSLKAFMGKCLFC